MVVISKFSFCPDVTQILPTSVYVFLKVRAGRISFSNKIITSMAVPYFVRPARLLRCDHC